MPRLVSCQAGNTPVSGSLGKGTEDLGMDIKKYQLITAVVCCIICTFTLSAKSTSSSTGKCDAHEKLGAGEARQSLIQNHIQIEVKEGTVTMFSAQVHCVILTITGQFLRWQKTNDCFSLTKPVCSSFASREFSDFSWKLGSGILSEGEYAI